MNLSRTHIGSWSLLGLACALPATPALAHARWFIDDSKIANVTYAFDGVYAAILIGAALFVMSAVLLERTAEQTPLLAKLLFDRWPIPRDLDWRILSSSLGYVLVATSFTQMVLAPNLKADGSALDVVILASQAVVGALFLAQTRLRIATALTVALPLLTIFAFSPLKVIDYAFEFIGLGMAFWIVAPQLQQRAPTRNAPSVRPSRLKKARPSLWPMVRERATAFLNRELDNDHRRDTRAGIEAASVLRTMLGIQLIILAAHDKIFEPGVSLAFVDQYSFVNFPKLLGLESFTNLHFVFGAGIAEIVFGLLLITNTGARVVAAMLTGLFTLTGLVFGLHEMLGHMPILFSLLVLVTQGGAQGSALASRTVRSTSAIGTALATILLGIIGIAFEPKPVEARISSLDLAPITQQAAGLSVPAALYERFTSLATKASLDGETIRDINLDIKAMLATAKGDTRTDKDTLASKLADLAIRYEMAHGADAASMWLRYAVLTAACSPSEIASFQARVKSQGWSSTLARVPASLRATLLPIAETAAAKILKQERIEGPMPWATLSERAPTQGPDYVYTHTLACIVRILAAASEAANGRRIETTSIN